MAQNRDGIHALAKDSGLLYSEVKLILFKILNNTPDAGMEARDFARRIRNR